MSSHIPRIEGKVYPRRILIIGPIGIGNLILLRPTIEKLREELRNAFISLVVLKRSFVNLVETYSCVDDIILIDQGGGSIFGAMRAILRLRRERFDVCISAFPSNDFRYSLLSFASGARLRLSHRYPRKRWRSLSFLHNLKVPMRPGLHDVEQNLSLLQALGIDVSSVKPALKIDLLPEDETYADAFLRSNGLEGRFLIGMHPGSSEERGMIYKRWGPGNFSKLGDILSERFGATILVFGGPEEGELKRHVAAAMRCPSLVVEGASLRQTASLIGRCKLFISNDSGPMHMAVAMGVPTVGLFGPTDHTRTAPYGDGNVVVRKGLPCSPCWKVQDVGIRRRCDRGISCMRDLSVEEVLGHVEDLIRELGIRDSGPRDRERRR